ncbi:16S rRNA (uracil(1498)-N(3))-methyltransferase [Salegentibacter sediminis]|uniref:16S rRNA (uracil(1498)-N(3))-methyltransferase n=1 Tax=Salegentibacter sediminis TaxID=1930251 RepID=UPI0009BF5A8C|nr:16S rRNA (uracil(1498)-N(3))-methyltransferase [Salegentibacter sediminis]
MQLFYNPEIDENQKNIEFPRDESKHIIKVLRKNTGDVLEVTNGRGFLFSVKITDANPNRCKAEIIASEKEEPDSWHLHMVVAPTKMNDRYEWFLEKATEIGLHRITPVICDHSERKHVKLNRFERVLQSAMKQSLHVRLPQLNEAENLEDFLKREIPGQKFIAHCEEGMERFQLKDKILASSEVTILIGPEGDFSPDEIKLALKNGWQPVSLGNSRLRTETAAIVACHTVALANL